MNTNYPLHGEAQLIAAEGKKYSAQRDFALILHPSSGDMWLDYVNLVDIHQDYLKNFTTQITIEFLIPKGDFEDYILKEKESLSATLIKRVSGTNTKTKYRIKFDTIEKTPTKDSNVSTEYKNKTAVLTVRAQLLDPLSEALIDKTINGTYRKSTILSVLSGVLTQAINSVNNKDIVGSKIVEITPPDNKRKYEQIIINDDTRIIDLPNYLQNGDYGVYNAGIGAFLNYEGDSHKLIVTSLYDARPTKENLGLNNQIDSGISAISSFSAGDIIGGLTAAKTAFDPNKPPKKLTILVMDTDSADHLDTTYRIDNDTLKIITSSKTAIRDNSSNDQINAGVGYKAVDPDAVKSRAVTVEKPGTKDAKVYHKKSNTMVDNATAKTKSNIYVRKHKGITNNHYRERSDVLANMGQTVNVKWVNSWPEAIRPFMLVDFIYSKNNKIVKRRGVLHGAHHKTDASKYTISSLFVYLMPDYNDDGLDLFNMF